MKVPSFSQKTITYFIYCDGTFIFAIFFIFHISHFRIYLTLVLPRLFLVSIPLNILLVAPEYCAATAILPFCARLELTILILLRRTIILSSLLSKFTM